VYFTGGQGAVRLANGEERAHLMVADDLKRRFVLAAQEPCHVRGGITAIASRS
jgi:hypothetical protein